MYMYATSAMNRFTFVHSSSLLRRCDTALAVPGGKVGIREDDSVTLRHVTQRAANLQETAVAALGRARVDLGEFRVILLVSTDEARLGASCVTFRVEAVDEEPRASKELGLAKHAVRSKCARKVINNNIRWLRPTSKQR